MRVPALITLILSCFAVQTLQAQGSDAGDGWRVGLSFGGISTFGVTVERFSDTHAVEVGAGTWSFRDVSLSAVYKEYIGGRALRPFAGLGLWTTIASPIMPNERTGFALVLRAPVGLDWAFVDDHAVGAALNLNLGLAVRRSDPEDDLPMNRRIVPLPEIYYRLRP
jgi:hypothetical protein